MIVSALTSYLLSKRKNSRFNDVSLPTLTKWYLNSHVIKSDDLESLDVGNKKTYAASTQDDELINKYFLMIGDVDPDKFDKMDSSLAQERRWRQWVDDSFVHVLSPNIYRTYDEALSSFNYFSTVGEWERNFSEWERKIVIPVGAAAMFWISKKLKKKYGLKDDVRQSFYDSINYWLKAIGPNKTFMGGSTPNLADLVS